MNHLHFVQSVEPLYGAGLGYAAADLNKALNGEGVVSRLVATRDALREEEIPGISQFPRMGPRKLFFSRDLSRKAREMVTAADLVHGHGFYVYPNFVFGGEARRQRKPFVYHAHGFLDPWILRRSRTKKRVSRWLFENANFKYAAFWRSLSLKEEQQIRDYGIKAPIVTLPNGVHLPPEREFEEVGRMVTRFPKKRAKRLVFLSRIHKKKGLDLLLPAWVALPRKLTADWEIALFGPDEGGYQAEVEALVRELGLGDVVSFYGSVSGEDKEAALRSGDLFILSSYSEGFPMAVLEAAAHGLPVVQTSECNFPELAGAEGAWECEPSVESVTSALHLALECDDAERRQRGERGRKLVSEEYSWRSIADRMEEACRSLL